MARASLALFCVLGACGCSRAPSSTMAAVLDSLVPGARIGALAAPLAHKYYLKLDGVFGYSSEYPNRAATDRAARGLPGIAVQVDEEVSLDHRPSDSARIVRVALDFYSRQAADSVRELLTRKLGPAASDGRLLLAGREVGRPHAAGATRHVSRRRAAHVRRHATRFAPGLQGRTARLM